MGVSRFNGTDAAKRTGCSSASAASQASRWLRTKAVQSYLAQERAALEIKVDTEEDALIQLLKTRTFFDIRDVIGWDANSVTLKASTDLTPELARCIAGVEEDITQAGKTIKIKFHDSQRALEALAKIKGLYKEEEGRGHAVVQFINYDQEDDE